MNSRRIPEVEGGWNDFARLLARNGPTIIRELEPGSWWAPFRNMLVKLAREIYRVD